MSMLTPPGMGGKYRVTGNQYPRMRPSRRRGRVVAASVATATTLGLIGWGTLQLVDVFGSASGGGKAVAGEQAVCPPTAKPSAKPNAASAPTLPEPAKITVNVYNATPKSGLAQKTADELEKRGFLIGKVGNAPVTYDKKVKGSALLLGSTGAKSALQVLGTQFPAPAKKTETKRTVPEVDLMIGTAFTALVSAKDAEKALAVLAEPVPAPSADTC